MENLTNHLFKVIERLEKKIFCKISPTTRAAFQGMLVFWLLSTSQIVVLFWLYLIVSGFR